MNLGRLDLGYTTLGYTTLGYTTLGATHLKQFNRLPLRNRLAELNWLIVTNRPHTFERNRRSRNEPLGASLSRI